MPVVYMHACGKLGFAYKWQMIPQYKIFNEIYGMRLSLSLSTAAD